MLERLNEAMERIEQALPGEVDVAELARIALTSEHHLRRMFSALAGMPLSEYVRRRRLTLAAAEVVAGRRTLLDIAVDHGYASNEAFTRAFRAVHGVGPGAVRRTGAALSSQSRMAFRLVIEGSSDMRYRIVERAEFAVVGRKARVPLVHKGMNPHIADFIRGLDKAEFAEIKKLNNEEPSGVVGVSADLDPSRAEGTELDYYHGVASSLPVPEGLDALPVAAGTWAVFSSTGEFPRALQEMWRDVFTQWFPSNPYRSRPGPEILSSTVFDDGKTAEAELWIPVEKE
ncbi:MULTISPECIES: AraC family transcriptional regulator [Actinosynnema]|uniref:AraC family transcriptional regulator n=1 Tax=Actinosynnema TaxID=40566 RepID=UPI0020A5CA7D|nr:AraC family transcriptional regulator [Actinosynnema pretiosum]MCP2095787.1 AraC family transcriptional regulator [Actinosynnema pretiosum]